MLSTSGKFSVIGITKANPNKVKYYHCPIHQGTRLLPMPGEDFYKCPECGMPYNPSQVKSDTKITSKFGKVHTGIAPGKPIISLTKKHHKLYDKMGNELPQQDTDIREAIAHGATVIRYHTTEES